MLRCISNSGHSRFARCSHSAQNMQDNTCLLNVIVMQAVIAGYADQALWGQAFVCGRFQMVAGDLGFGVTKRCVEFPFVRYVHAIC